MFLPQIGLDLMGSEIDPFHLLQQILRFSRNHPQNFQIHLFGSTDLEQSFLEQSSHFPPDKRPIYHVCESVITMEDPPLKAVRTKRNSSLCKAVFALQKQTIHALISCANTGAMLSAATLFLSTIEGVTRPALCIFVPTKKRPTAILDIGASVSARETRLLEFALMGTAYQKALGLTHPKVALLNIGREQFKGGLFMQKCYQLLEQHPKRFSFVGNIEPKAVFEGDADIVVTDGFAGNIFLKTAEALVDYFAHLLQDKSNPTKQPSSFSQNPLYQAYPGALLLGVQGIIIKCHGNTNMSGIFASVENALQLSRCDLIRKVGDSLYCP